MLKPREPSLLRYRWFRRLLRCLRRSVGRCSPKSSRLCSRESTTTGRLQTNPPSPRPSLIEIEHRLKMPQTGRNQAFKIDSCPTDFHWYSFYLRLSVWLIV